MDIGRNWGRYKHLTWILTHNNTWDKIFKMLGFRKGWHTRRDTLYIKQAKKELIRIFTPEVHIVNKANKQFEEIRKNVDIIIGVHIRRGDYATWNNGLFYYDISDYYSFMRQVKKLYEDKKVAFFISSNEKVTCNMFENLQCYYYEDNSSPMLDLYSLSLCDMIIGPYSTFSRWASFFGEKPICFLENKSQIIAKESFSTVVDFFHLADKRELVDW